MIRVGPAGWSYPDWEGRVYPKQKGRDFHGLPFLAESFGSLEVNSTFYALPTARTTAKWVEHLRPYPDFHLVLKLYQGFTHRDESESELGWSVEAERYEAGIAPLVRHKRLSALLVQFPISFHESPAAVRRLARIRALFDTHSLVVELRHNSWFTPPALNEVGGLGYSLAHIDLPPAWNHPPDWHAPTGPIGYLRLHGRNANQWFRHGAGRDDRYNYLYSPDELRALTRKAERIDAAVDATYVITNNHFEGQAVANAIELQYLLRGDSTQASHELVRAYPHLQPITRPRGQAELF